MRRTLGIGFAAAAIIYALPFTRFVISAIVTLFHELGHAVAGWLLGYPSLPAFDFVYGGGFTHMGEFHLSIAVAVFLGFAYLLWLFRENRKLQIVIGAALAVWLIFVTKEWRREVLFASAGHASELVLAGVFLYKTLKGDQRYGMAGAFVAFFVQINSLVFAWKLTHDASFLDWYREGKGGALMNDLETVALDLQIHLGIQPGIEGVARLLLFASVLPTIVALLWWAKPWSRRPSHAIRTRAPLARPSAPAGPRLRR